MCGFQGAPATAYATQDIEALLTLHMEHGAQWHAPGFHSGYNELTVNSKAYNQMLPDSVLGFFYVKGTSPAGHR